MEMSGQLHAPADLLAEKEPVLKYNAMKTYWEVDV
jgi:hypothetical protein